MYSVSLKYFMQQLQRKILHLSPCCCLKYVHALFAGNNFVIMLMCIVVHNLYLIVSKLLMTTYCGLSDNSVRSVGTCNLCLMYYMASLASGGFEISIMYTYF